MPMLYLIPVLGWHVRFLPMSFVFPGSNRGLLDSFCRQNKLGFQYVKVMSEFSRMGWLLLI